MCPVIRADNVSKSFGNKSVISGLTFGIDPGEVVGLLGPNGSGKTTMVRLLNGVLRPDSGTVSVSGLDPLAHGRQVRQMSGVLTESADFYQNMSALDNLRFFADIYGAADPDRPVRLLQDFGLGDDMHRRVGTYSTGMRKRLGLAKALLHEPSVLFLDEPTNGLDPDGTRMVLQSIRQLKLRESVTILICSHLLQQLELVCDRYLFIDEGQLIEAGTLPQLRERYQQGVQLAVQTGLETPDNAFQGREYGITTSNGIRWLNFELADRGEVPVLLRELVTVAEVYGAQIREPALEDLYFAILKDGAA